MDFDVPMHVIGVVRTVHAELATTPIQAGLNRAEQGTIEIADRYREGLAGLADFDYAWLLTWLHKLAEPGAGSTNARYRPEPTDHTDACLGTSYMSQ